MGGFLNTKSVEVDKKNQICTPMCKIMLDRYISVPTGPYHPNQCALQNDISGYKRGLIPSFRSHSRRSCDAKQKQADVLDVQPVEYTQDVFCIIDRGNVYFMRCDG